MLAWAHFQPAISRWSQFSQNLGFGVLMGAGAVLVMQFAIELREGLYFDLRTVAIALAGVFAGPIGAGVALIAASAQRLLIGGDGVAGGIVTMGIVAALSVGGFYLRRGRPVSLRYVIMFGAVISVVSTAGVVYATLRLHPDQVRYRSPSLSAFRVRVVRVQRRDHGQEARQRQLREAFVKPGAVRSRARGNVGRHRDVRRMRERLVFSNEQYPRVFPRTRDLRVPGTRSSDILRGVVERGEQLGAPETDSEGWIEEMIALILGRARKRFSSSMAAG